MTAPALTPELVVDDAAVVAETTELLTQLTVAPITCDTEAEAAGAARSAIGRRMKFVTEWFKPLVDNAFKQHRMLTERRGTALQPLEARDQELAKAISAYMTARSLAAAEAKRLADAKARQDEDERIAREAAALEDAGDREAAAAVVEQHLAAPSLPAALAAPAKLAGVTMVEAYSYEIVNKELIPRKHLIPNDKTIGAEVKAFGKDTKIPGVRVFRQDIARRGR